MEPAHSQPSAPRASESGHSTPFSDLGPRWVDGVGARDPSASAQEI